MSNENFNALAKQLKVVGHNMRPGDTNLAIMPIFHGFGIGNSVHAQLCGKVSVILLPTFDAKKFDRLLKKYKPNMICGVPTLWEAMIKNKGFEHHDMSYLKYVVSGGDTLSVSQEENMNNFLRQHKSRITLCKGLGMTECLAAATFTHNKSNKLLSVGAPLPGNAIKIVRPETSEELGYHQEGEICISGPTVMLGYYHNEEETEKTLRIHDDQKVWLHTGDIGYLDETGTVFFTQRLKRIIVSSGYNVYPSRIEEVTKSHHTVDNCMVVSMPHKYKIQVPKAYIVLKDLYKSTDEIQQEIQELCRQNLAKYSLPYEYEFRQSLPKTLLGKINYRELQNEANIEDNEK